MVGKNAHEKQPAWLEQDSLLAAAKFFSILYVFEQGLKLR